MVNDVLQNISDYFFVLVSPQSVMNNVTFLGLVLLTLIIGFLLGSVVSLIVQSLAKTKKLEQVLVKYGAVTSELWDSMINFITEYLKWLIVLLSVNTVFVSYDIVLVTQLSVFLMKLFALIVSTALGMLLGGVVFKITKDFLISVGLERELGKHHLADSISGFSVSTIVAFVIKWYIVLLFLTTGLQLFQPAIQIEGGPTIVLLTGMERLANYIPQAILGFIIILVSIIISDFVSEHIKHRTIRFSDIYALFTEVVIISIGALLSLPHFGVKNTYFLEYSFIVLMGGISLGIAIAIGMSFKDKLKSF